MRNVLIVLVLACLVLVGCASTDPAPEAPVIPKEMVRQYPSCTPLVLEVKYGEKEEPAVTRRLAELHDAFQAKRTFDTANPELPPDYWDQVYKEDAERMTEVMELLTQAKVASAEGLYYAAVLFENGNCPEHFKLAADLADRAIKGGRGAAKRVYAFALDRYLAAQGKPQKFGTHYAHYEGRYVLYPVDPATTDEERLAYDLPTLDQAKAMADEINLNAGL